MNSLLQKVISKTAKSLFIDEDLLHHWLEQQEDIHDEIKFSLLYFAQKHQLDPIADEITFIKYPEANYQIFITINGWAKLMENHPQFAGLSLRESTELKNDMPLWMECSIYRNDRILPIVIKEYMVEIRTNHPSWQNMPRRMLRHRVIQQCAKLAFGFSVTEAANQMQGSRELTIRTEKNIEMNSLPISRAQLLKKKLSG